MRKLLSVLVCTLAVNFLAVVAGVVYLRQSGRLDAAKVQAIRDLLFPPAAADDDQAPATQPADGAATRPALRLEELLARTSGRPAAEQLEYIRAAFDAQMAQLDHAHRKLLALQQQVKAAQEQVTVDRKQLDADRAALDARAREAERLATDQGFQDSLALYQSLPAKQVKTVFMGLEDATVIRYLQAMEPRAAAKITKEFKTAEEVERLTRLLEKMRTASATAAATAAATPAASSGPLTSSPSPSPSPANP